MAISIIVPGARPPDLTTLKELVVLFAQTPHPITASTLRRQLRSASIQAWGMGRAEAFSFSAALIVHRDWVNGRMRPRS